MPTGMDRPARHPTVLRRLAAALVLVPVLLAVLLAALIPAGLMPARAADGALTLVLCTPEGPVTLAVDPATGEPVQPSAPDRCAWAMAHAAAVLPAPLPAITPAACAAEPLRAVPSALAAPRREAASPLPRGPPSLT